MITTILSTVFVLGVLVFIHEAGHFLAAKLFKIRVERFSMGLPPRMIGKQIGETDYCLSWIPFGGYVKISGMVDESLDEKQLEGPPQPWEFRSRSWFQKSLVVTAGPLMNIVFALIFFVVLSFVTGELLNEPVVGNLMPEKPAAAAGLAEGDRIVKVNDRETQTWEALTREIRSYPGERIQLEVMRNNALMTIELTTETQTIQTGPETEEQIGLVGIQPVVKKTSIPGAFVNGAVATYDISKLIVESLWKLISGQESVKSLGGPVIIAKMAGESARNGFGTLLSFTALLSINLALLNLLPLPVLDGGHFLMISIEAVVRRTIPTKAKLIIQQVGMVLILGLMFFVIYNDIVRVVSDKG